jgi:signal peptidase I
MFRPVIKFVLVAVLLGAISLAVYYLVFIRLVRVPTASMSNTIIPGDHLVIKKRAFGEIRRGDIILFNYPNDSQTYLARVIGLPGETVQVRGREVLINGDELSEQRVTVDLVIGGSGPLKEESTEGDGDYRVFYNSTLLEDEYPFAGLQPFRIPEKQYFVMGDNRDNSEDSRWRGPVSSESVLGKPTMIYWSAFRTPQSTEEDVRWDRVFQKIR